MGFPGSAGPSMLLEVSRNSTLDQVSNNPRPRARDTARIAID
ncbi:hypothetical protein [Lentzea atacamensis]|nr:hypothetical protein [Lentzea atacamensis]